MLLGLFGLRIANDTGSVLAAVLSVLGLAAFIFVLVTFFRRRTARSISDLAEGGKLSLMGALQLSTLPPNWERAATETFALTASSSDALTVDVLAEDLWLRVHSRSMLGFKGHPFRAQVPLADLTGVYVGEPVIGIVGSTLTFLLNDDRTFTVELMTGPDTTEVAAERFRSEAARAQALPRPEGPIGVVSDPPPMRIPPGRAWVMGLIPAAPFIVAMFNAEEGAWGAGISAVAFFLGFGVMFFRSVKLAKLVTIGCGLVAAGFLADYILAGTPISLLGLAVAGAAAFLLARMTARSAGEAAVE